MEIVTLRHERKPTVGNHWIPMARLDNSNPRRRAVQFRSDPVSGHLPSTPIALFTIMLRPLHKWKLLLGSLYLVGFALPGSNSLGRTDWVAA